MRTSVLEGREFRWSDSEARANVVILNAAAEKALFPGEKTLGQHVSDDGGKTWREIVGIVEDARYSSIRAKSPPTIYYPATRYMEQGSSLVFMLRGFWSGGTRHFRSRRTHKQERAGASSTRRDKHGRDCD